MHLLRSSSCKVFPPVMKGRTAISRSNSWHIRNFSQKAVKLKSTCTLLWASDSMFPYKLNMWRAVKHPLKMEFSQYKASTARLDLNPYHETINQLSRNRTRVAQLICSRNRSIQQLNVQGNQPVLPIDFSLSMFAERFNQWQFKSIKRTNVIKKSAAPLEVMFATTVSNATQRCNVETML